MDNKLPLNHITVYAQVAEDTQIINANTPQAEARTRIEFASEKGTTFIDMKTFGAKADEAFDLLRKGVFTLVHGTLREERFSRQGTSESRVRIYISDCEDHGFEVFERPIYANTIFSDIQITGTLTHIGPITEKNGVKARKIKFTSPYTVVNDEGGYSYLENSFEAMIYNDIAENIPSDINQCGLVSIQGYIHESHWKSKEGEDHAKLFIFPKILMVHGRAA